MVPASNGKCPCGSGKSFSSCCRPLLEGTPAPDARALMRSRYTAFLYKDKNYLLLTWHPSTRPDKLDFEPIDWIGLKVVSYEPLSESKAKVHFIAKGRIEGRLFRQEEVSRFVKENGQWFYVDGIIGR